MNNKGFSLNDLLLCLGIIAFALILSTLLFQAKFKEVDALLKGETPEETPSTNAITYTYEDMELELVTAATKYIEKKVEQGTQYQNSAKITLDTLVKEGLYTSVYDPKKPEQKCDGYVLFKKKNSTISYTPHLKCEGNYETK